uniref:ankyrin repeat domain-containing protein 39-like n=1 Tax=Styela clava TaxID=7725 RepID=UPI001939C130|nr:ankyrin repeat domain-containing protein 39-like [Styela clava]
MNTHNHDHLAGVGGVFQTLDEIDFARGPWTPAMYGDYPAIKLYLQKGGEPNLMDSSGYTPLHYAARGGYYNICNELILSGASVNHTTKSGKSTSLHRAASQGCNDVVKLLIKNGANPRMIDDDGKTALHKAAEGNHAEVCRLLIESAPDTQNVLDKKVKYPKDYVLCTDDQKETYKVMWWT